MPIAGLAYAAQFRLTDFEHVFGERSDTAPMKALISPLYNEKPQLFDQAFPNVTSKDMRNLLQQLQDLVGLWRKGCYRCSLISPASRTRYTRIKRTIEGLPSSMNQSCSDLIYKSCHLTTLLMIRAFENSKSWAEATKGTTLRETIREALSRTELGSLWGDNLGLLYWIVLVMHCSSFGTPEFMF
jgi:hypothetical protein